MPYRSRMRIRGPLLLFVAVGVVLSACGDTKVLPSDLPRTTAEEISISIVTTEEVLPLAGCHTAWESQGKEPPPGACEQTMQVRRYVARHSPGSVETQVIGDIRIDPLYTMNLISRNEADGISIVVIAPPSRAAEIRLVTPAGETLDRTTPTGPLVALAGLDTTADVEALSDVGEVIASCPHAGVVINGVVYACTIASGAEVPVTTTTPASGAAP
jgi:hypothetical protein